MTVTARDVAAKAGVSVSTVSRALARPELVSPITQARIATIAQDLGYAPNPVARSLSVGRTYNLGLVVPDLENPFFSAVAKGVQSYARMLGYTTFIADTDENAAVEVELVKHLAGQADGVLLCSPRVDEDDILALSAITPLVVLNRPVPSIPSVSLDHADGMRQALRHLSALGHRVIAYAGGPPASWSGRMRRDCVLRALADDPVMEGVDLGHFPPVHHGGVAAADLALASGATAVIAHNDLMAIGLIQRLGLRDVRVPERMSVVGVDDIPQARLVSPPLTTVSAALHQLGRTAVDVILNPTPAPVEKLMPVDLIVRASTAEAPPEPGAASRIRRLVTTS